MQNCKKGKRKCNFFMHFLKFFQQNPPDLPYTLFTNFSLSLATDIFPSREALHFSISCGSVREKTNM